MKRFIYIIYLLLLTSVHAQKKDSLPLKLEDYILIKRGDTLNIQLEEIALLPKHKFKSPVDARYYYWFRSKVHKAYPYAVLAAKRLDSLNARLARMKNNRQKRRYTKRAQKYLENQFTDPLKKLTKTEGRVLIKLIHRQTGETAFENIREVRSGWKAFWYNVTANIFRLSLKEEYRPQTENEDYLIEDVLQRSFIEGSLEKQKSKLSIDFPKIAAERKGEINVEFYKALFGKPTTGE